MDGLAVGTMRAGDGEHEDHVTAAAVLVGRCCAYAALACNKTWLHLPAAAAGQQVPVMVSMKKAMWLRLLCSLAAVAPTERLPASIDGFNCQHQQPEVQTSASDGEHEDHVAAAAVLVGCCRAYAALACSVGSLSQQRDSQSLLLASSLLPGILQHAGAKM